MLNTYCSSEENCERMHEPLEKNKKEVDKVSKYGILTQKRGTMIKKGDPENARLLNRSLILRELKKHGEVSRAELARSLDLSKMTISAIVTDLISEGFICESGEGNAMKQGGRKPRLLTLSGDHMYVLGVDVGLTNTTVAVANLKGQLLLKQKIPTRRNHSLKSIVEQIIELIDTLIKEFAVSKSEVLGVGLSIGGLLDKNQGYISFSPDFNWKDVYLGTMLEDTLGLPVVIDNCSRVMALGEKWYGNAVAAGNFFYVNVGYGIGSAIVIENKIYEKNSEFGHVYITKRDVVCDCGKTGCLESVSSGQAIEKAANRRLNNDDSDWLTARDVAAMALQGNEVAKQIFEDAGKYLGRALAIAANLFNPDKIIIGGGLSNAGDLLLVPLKQEFQIHCMDIIKDSTQIELSGLGIDGGVVGAVSLALDQYVFHSERL
ncbi:MAG: ROK family transcriptional regulator [Spirochaetia bacterium]|nr:ROK family transcriptional regulator [Spirochaetia bacterium]